MNIKIVKKGISKFELEELAKEFYIEMVKGVADVEKGIIKMDQNSKICGDSTFI